MENREIVFTQFARDIISFSEHKITRYELYDRFCAYIAMSDEDERTSQKEWELFLNENKCVGIMESNKIPVNSYKLGKDVINKL